jgi:hypothetical protein
MAIKQKDAVYAAFQAGREQGLEGNSLRDFAVEQVKVGLMSGEVAHSEGQFADEKKAQTYARSLVSNWAKKDERLNGGAKYVPTTRRGPQVKDDELKKLNEALKSLRVHDSGNMALISQIEQRMAARKQSLQAEKAGAKVQTLEETMAALEGLGIDLTETES